MSNLFIKGFPFLIILLFSLYASSKLFNPQFFTSHDGEGHVIRIIEFDHALKEGQFPVRYAARIYHGVGYPYYNFNYPFIYYFGEALILLGLPYVGVFKAILFLSVLLGGTGTYLFSRKYFSELPSTTAAIFYIFAPYRFLVMYVRGAVAEAFALGLLPFLFFFTQDLIERKKRGFWGLIIVLSILITSHNITAFYTTPFLILYFILRILKNSDKKKLIKRFILVFIISAMLTAFFWFPALYEEPNTKLTELSEDYKFFFSSLSELIYSPWGFGPYKQEDVPGKMSPQLGVVFVAVTVIALVILTIRLFRKKREEKDYLLLGFLSVSFVLFFLSTPFSIFIWDNFYYLRLVQHPWRIVGYMVLTISISAAYVISFVKNKFFSYLMFTVLLILVLYSTRNMVRVNMYIPFNNPFDYASLYGFSTTSKDEHIPRVAHRVRVDPNPNGDLIASSSGTAKRVLWKTTYHKFELDLKKPSDFRDNINYFPGWEGFIDGKKVPLLYKTDELYMLRVNVPAGKHVVEFKYSEIWYRLIADLLSLFTFCGIVLYILWEKLTKKKSSRKSQKRSKSAKNAK